MRDAILTYDDGAIGETGGDVVSEITVYGWDDTD